MLRKHLIGLFFLAFVGARHAVPLQGLVFAQQPQTECPPECTIDTMEIVTWYPSPYNEYEELRLYPKHSAEESQCNSFAQLGLMYYNQDEYTLKICRQDPDTLSYGWEKIGEGLWKLSGAGIFNTNSGGVNINGNIQDGTVVIYDTATNKVSQEVLPFKKGDLIAPGDRPLISSGANYAADYFSIQNLGISGLSASNVKQGVKFGPGNSIEGAATFTAPAFTLTGGNVQCPAGYKAVSYNWNSASYVIKYYFECPGGSLTSTSCSIGGGWSLAPISNPKTVSGWEQIRQCTDNAGRIVRCPCETWTLPCQTRDWSQVKCEPV